VRGLREMGELGKAETEKKKRKKAEKKKRKKAETEKKRKKTETEKKREMNAKRKREKRSWLWCCLAVGKLRELCKVPFFV